MSNFWNYTKGHKFSSILLDIKNEKLISQDNEKYFKKNLQSFKKKPIFKLVFYLECLFID